MAAINNATPLGAILSSRDTLRIGEFSLLSRFHARRSRSLSLSLSFSLCFSSPLAQPSPYRSEAPQYHFRYTARRGIHRSVSATTLDP